MSHQQTCRLLLSSSKQMKAVLVAPTRAKHTAPAVGAGPQRKQHTAAQESEEHLFNKKVPFRNDYSVEACDARRKWAEVQTGVKLSAMGQWLDEHDTTSLKGNIELPMGLVKVPVAPIGPLTINGQAAQGEFIAPFATTEGALTASVMRGVTAINAGSGAIAWTGTQHATRGPCFVTRSPQEAIMMGKWAKSQVERIQEEVVRKVSGHAILQDIIPLYDMEAVHAVFQFSTADACGQNVATVCTWAAMKWIMKNMPNDLPGVGIKHAWVEANATMDKKPGAMNILTTRGMSTQAKCTIPEEALNKHLGVTSEDYLIFAHYAKRMTAKNSAGGGWHINPGNTLAALYMALGQDVACVSDSVAGVQFEAEKHKGEEGGIDFSLTFPSLLVGSVGGGTALPTQQEGLAMIGCQGVGKVRKLAEVCASFALALDISTTTAIVAGKFATGHDKLGRNRPEENK